MVDNSKYQFIPATAGILGILGFSNLVFRVYKTKDTNHLTWSWLFLAFSAQILAITYGILTKAWGIFLPPVILISGLLLILYVKLTYKNNDNIENKFK